MSMNNTGLAHTEMRYLLNVEGSEIQFDITVKNMKLLKKEDVIVVISIAKAMTLLDVLGYTHEEIEASMYSQEHCEKLIDDRQDFTNTDCPIDSKSSSISKNSHLLEMTELNKEVSSMPPISRTDESVFNLTSDESAIVVNRETCGSNVDDICNKSDDFNMDVSTDEEVDMCSVPVTAIQRPRPRGNPAKRAPLSHPQRKRNNHEKSDCGVCGKSIANRRMKEHNKIHGQKKFSCSLCPLKFVRQSALTQHQEVHREKTLQCPLCPLKFVANRRLLQHMRSHDQTKQTNTQTLKSEAQLVSTHADTSSVGKAQDTSADLWRASDVTTPPVESTVRVQQPTKGKRADCEICGKSVVRMSDHIKIHGERKFACSVCSVKFVTKDGLIKHSLTHGERTIECPVCPLKFKTNHRLSQHMKVHRKPAVNEKGELISSRRVKRYIVCDVCGKHIASDKINQHLKIHGEKKFHCSHCPIKFTNKQALEKHERTHSGIRPYMCSVCGHRSATSAHLREHSLIHTGSKPHICPYCGNCFRNRSNYNIHIRRHTGDKPYKCSDCPSAFVHSTELNVHVRKMHTGERIQYNRPYPCPKSLCDKMFTTAAIAQQHLAIHTDVKPFACTMCKYRTRRRRVLKAHIQSHRQGTIKC